MGVYATLCVMLAVGMLCFGPRILEWIENPSETPGA